jgi:hypothetical protein
MLINKLTTVKNVDKMTENVYLVPRQIVARQNVAQQNVPFPFFDKSKLLVL